MQLTSRMATLRLVIGSISCSRRPLQSVISLFGKAKRKSSGSFTFQLLPRPDHRRKAIDLPPEEDPSVGIANSSAPQCKMRHNGNQVTTSRPLFTVGHISGDGGSAQKRRTQFERNRPPQTMNRRSSALFPAANEADIAAGRLKLAAAVAPCLKAYRVSLVRPRVEMEPFKRSIQ